MHEYVHGAHRRRPTRLYTLCNAALRRAGRAHPGGELHQLLPFPHAADPEVPLLQLGAHLLSNDYCLSEIRLQGNAYGAWCGYDPYRSC